jgi:hypothetical protein
LGADGHHGFDPATVLPMVPPNGFALPAAIAFLPLFRCNRGCPAGPPGSRQHAIGALPQTIIRIIIMVI